MRTIKMSGTVGLSQNWSGGGSAVLEIAPGLIVDVRRLAAETTLSLAETGDDSACHNQCCYQLFNRADRP